MYFVSVLFIIDWVIVTFLHVYYQIAWILKARGLYSLAYGPLKGL